MRMSLRTTAVATMIAVVVGALAALAITAARRRGRLLDTGLMLPIATSAVTIGFGMLITFDVPPVDWRASWWLVPVGQALVAVPFVVRTVLPVLRGIDPQPPRRGRHARRLAGPGLARGDRRPHLRRPLVAAAGLAAAISLGEFGATSFLSRSGSETMPIAIERLLGRTGSPRRRPRATYSPPSSPRRPWRSSSPSTPTGDRRPAIMSGRARRS